MKTWLKLFTVFSLMIALTVQVQAVPGELFVLSSTNEDPLSGVFFFGESTTAHLARSGGVLDTEKGRGKVLRDESGTRYLDARILSSPVLYYEKGKAEKISFIQAVERAQPRVLVLSFGLNGISRWSRNPDAFLRNYRALIEGILARSPNTKMILQSVYPVGENTVFSLSKGELNQQICNLNVHIEKLAQEYENTEYINTSELLFDASGALSATFDSGDGIHLTNEAYRMILAFLEQTIEAE